MTKKKTAKKGPKKYTLEKVQEICEWIAKGANNLEAANLSGISEDTFYTWQRPTVMKDDKEIKNPDYHPEFSESLKKAYQLRKTTLVNRILVASKRSWQAAAWYLERQFPEEYSERKKLELTTPEDKIKKVVDLIKEKTTPTQDEEVGEKINKDDNSKSEPVSNNGGDVLPKQEGSAVSTDDRTDGDI